VRLRAIGTSEVRVKEIFRLRAAEADFKAKSKQTKGLRAITVERDWKFLECEYSHGCHADVFRWTDGWTDDRTMAAGVSVT
jgi:hypothetical protein